MDYRNLSKCEKLTEIQDYRFCRNERHHAAVYLSGIRTENTEVIDQYESFGRDIHHIILNKRSYEQGLIFGYTSRELDENGWLERPEFLDVERIEFIDRKGWAAHNYVTIGRGANGKWSYGASYSTGGAGGGYGLSVWGEVFDSRKECLAAALQELMNRHRDSAIRLKNDTTNFNATLSNIVVRQIKDMYDTLTGRKTVQLSLTF